MGELFERIRAAVVEDHYVIGIHAANKLDDLGVPDWQVLTGIADGELLVERPLAKPNAAVEVRQFLPDGTAIKAVWSWLPISEAAKLVTVHFFDR